VAEAVSAGLIGGGSFHASGGGRKKEAKNLFVLLKSNTFIDVPGKLPKRL
jgi:hypothetical protein